MNPEDQNNLVSGVGLFEELMLTRRMDMENIRKLLEKLAKGIQEVKTSQDEMKTNKIGHKYPKTFSPCPFGLPGRGR